MKVLVIDDEHEHIVPILNGLKRRKKRKKWDYYYPEYDNVADIKKDITDNLDFTPDVILLDLMIPEAKGGDKNHRGGLDLLEMIQNGEFSQIPSNVKIIVLSADEKLDEVRKSHGFKINEFIAKPCNLNQLFTVIENIKG